MLALAIFFSLGTVIWLLLSTSALKYRGDRVFVKDLPTDLPNTRWPKVSVIVPSRNEEQRLKTAIHSLMAQTYPSFEVILVNDRSTDSTPLIIEGLKKEYSRLTGINITHLPEGWMGKAHALKVGAMHAKGDWILFTDADAVWTNDVLKKAMGFCLSKNMDFVSMLYQPIIKSVWERLFLMAFYNFGFMTWQTWKVNDPKSKANLAVGTFCLFSKNVFETIGGMENLRLSIPNDAQLGKAAKLNHFRCGVLWGKDAFLCRWQEGLIGLITGVEKNFFAHCKFSFAIATAITTAILLINMGPLFGLVFALLGHSAPLFALNSLGLILTSLFCRHYLSQLDWRFLDIFLLPVGGVFLASALIWSIFETTRQNGIRWRDNFYDKETVLSFLNKRDLELEQTWKNPKFRKVA